MSWEENVGYSLYQALQQGEEEFYHQYSVQEKLQVELKVKEQIVELFE